MQQKLLTQKTGSLSKTLMSIAMIGFFEIFSLNTAATAQECRSINDLDECEKNDACLWIPFGAECVGENHCYGLDPVACNQAQGCYEVQLPPQAGACYTR